MLNNMAETLHKLSWVCIKIEKFAILIGIKKWIWLDETETVTARAY